MNPSTSTVYICDVIIHLNGLRFGSNNKQTLSNLRRRLQKMKHYGEQFFPNFTKQYMIWSPYVPKGALIDGLFKLKREVGLDVHYVMNSIFKKEIDRLTRKAEQETYDYGEPFFRALQITTQLRKS